MLLTEDFLEKIESLVNSSMNPVKYLGIDPGKSNGVCGYDSRYHVVFMLTVPEELMIEFLEVFKGVEKCIMENFILFPNKRTEANYSDMLTSRMIGRVEHWANINNIEVIKQGPNVKKTGYAWLGMQSPSKSNPNNHELDAHCHFTYWAVKNGLMKAEDLLKTPSDSGTYILQK